MGVKWFKVEVVEITKYNAWVSLPDSVGDGEGAMLAKRCVQQTDATFDQMTKVSSDTNVDVGARVAPVDVEGYCELSVASVLSLPQFTELVLALGKGDGDGGKTAFKTYVEHMQNKWKERTSKDVEGEVKKMKAAIHSKLTASDRMLLGLKV